MSMPPNALDPVEAPGLACGRLVRAEIATPLGPMVAVAAGERLCLLEFADRPMLATQLARIRRRFEADIVDGRAAVLDDIAGELDAYFDGRLRDFGVPVADAGSPWQTRVWRWLRSVPYGERRSYADGAAALGRPSAPRAFGRANGDNRLAIVVPCHRIVGADGALTGYGGGLWRKRALLDLEARTAALTSRG